MSIKLPYYKQRLRILRQNAKDQTDWAYDMYNIDAAHEAGFKGQGQVVAILDTGYNNKHLDLVDMTVRKVGKNHWEGENVLHIESFEGGDPYDRNFHSTWIHGAMGAVHNGLGVKGRLPSAKFVILKVLADSGSGNPYHAINGIRRCIDLGYVTDIVMSLGMQSHMPEFEAACNDAYQAGIWLHGAAGNDSNRNPIDFPAAYDSVLSWSSHGKTGKRSWFADKGEVLDLYGPGEGVLSTYGYNDYALNDGTSMAGPNGASNIILFRKQVSQMLGHDMTYDDIHLISSPIKQLIDVG